MNHLFFKKYLQKHVLYTPSFCIIFVSQKMSLPRDNFLPTANVIQHHLDVFLPILTTFNFHKTVYRKNNTPLGPDRFFRTWFLMFRHPAYGLVPTLLKRSVLGNLRYSPGAVSIIVPSEIVSRFSCAQLTLSMRRPLRTKPEKT